MTSAIDSSIMSTNIRLRPILRGIKSYLPFFQYPTGTGGTISARYCYSVWLRHQSVLYNHGLNPYPQTIAELGPGDSLGIGLAALLSGVERYVALDVVPHATPERNLQVFDDLIPLFRSRSPIPDQTEFPAVFPRLDDYQFPVHILNEERLATALAPERIDRIRSDLTALGASEASDVINYVCPWSEAGVIQPESTDLIFSQAVLEHVNDIRYAYRACHQWLKPGGVMSHQIDFKSHGITTAWNGHWGYPDWLWRITRGKKPYFINREPLSTHLAAIEAAGFEIIAVLPEIRSDGLTRDQLAGRFRNMPDEDILTSSAHILARKPS